MKQAGVLLALMLLMHSSAALVIVFKLNSCPVRSLM